MHIPDGFLDTKTWVVTWGISGATVGYAIKKMEKEIDEKKIPLMGVTASFIFAAQMLNFPVMGGTSGHFVGGVLAAILLGPWAGLLVMTTVLVVQCLIFQDGGLTALGANIFNMGIIGSFLGYYIYKWLSTVMSKKAGELFVPAFLASWIATVLAASFCAIELSISGTVPLVVSLPAMAGIHALIGIGEGVITVLVLGFIKKVRIDLLVPERGY